jgi:two-component system, OmpR family, KDP operon response regulator KdpE
MTSGIAQILVVDDEAQIRRLIGAMLMRAGYAAIEARDAKEAKMLFSTHNPDAVLIDLGLPDRDGLELVAEFARAGDAAILIVSARDATAEKIAALDLGADDYVTKPFDTDELLARLRAALRRRHSGVEPLRARQFGDIRFDEAARLVWRNNRDVHLTPKEYALFAMLARDAGKVITHANLLRTIWGPAHTNDIEYLRVTARALRIKLEADPGRPSLIRNEPGIGYRLCPDHDVGKRG